MRKIFTLLSLSVFLVSTLSVSLPSKAFAVSGSDWKPGRIIDDGMFTNANDMNVADIQSFLNSKVPNCDTWGTQPATDWGRSDLTRAQYAASRGWPAPPYVCLRNYHEVPKTDPSPGIPVNSFQNAGNPPSGSISAAQMIYNASQRYQINPKALLVTIQKESIGPLTVDNWPLEKQYTYAMGAYCPDSGPGGSANCDPNYAGFSIQIAQSARLMRYYLDNMQQPWWTYKKPFQTNSILWNVAQTGCGASDVYIETKATAALYTYTPYQPNQAALNNMYGTGDGCSAYGNRNFWRIWNDWFGSTTVNFKATFVSQSAYPTLTTNQSTRAFIRYANSGSKPWYDDVSAPQYKTYPVHLATSNPINQASPFSAGWPTSNRASGMFSKVFQPDGVTLAPDQHVAQPGQIVEFNFPLTASTKPGYYQQFFQPVLEGSTMWDMGGVAWLGITVQPIKFRATFAGQSNFPTIPKGASVPVYFRFINSGNMPWYDDLSANQLRTYPIHLATTSPINQASPFSAGWPTSNRASGMFSKVFQPDGVTLAPDQHVAQPGQIVEMSFPLTVPVSQPSGIYRASFQPILEGSVFWNMDGIVWLDVTIP